MEDCDFFLVKCRIKTTIIIIEDDENFVVENLFSSNIEIIPIKFNYDLFSFSNDYIAKTKKLFIFYFYDNN